MKLIINGEEQSLDNVSSVSSLLQQLGLKADRVAIELNREIAARALWDSTQLKDGDRLEIVQFVGGGSCANGGGDCYAIASPKSYNRLMRVVVVFIAVLLSMTLHGQESTRSGSAANQGQTAASCGGGHTVDDYLAEKDKIRRKRNTSPLPSDVCILGWCRANPNAPTPDNLPTSHPPQDASPQGATSNQTESSSKPVPLDVCDPYSAAQDVEVGDFYYRDKSYRPALSRYESALKSKPGDPGIYLRLGKTAEKLGEDARAQREYQASIDAGPDQPSAKEARAAIERIKSKKSSQ